MFLLQELHWRSIGGATSGVCTGEEGMEPLDDTLTAVTQLSTVALAFDSQPRRFNLERNVTPFLVHVVYQATSFLIKQSSGIPDEKAEETIELFKNILRRSVPRWRVASKFPTTKPTM